MRAAVIVAPQPLRGQGLCFGQAVEYVPIKAFFTHGAVEALHISILLRVARLRVSQFNPFGFGPILVLVTDKLRPVVAAQAFGCAAPFKQSLEFLNQSAGGQTLINSGAQSFTIEVVNDVEHANAGTACQLVAHEIDGQRVVGRYWLEQDFRDFALYPRSAMAAVLETQARVNAVQAFFVVALV